jgi:tripartite-type tricarboxylate transporter receptor subunit TctC
MFESITTSGGDRKDGTYSASPMRLLLGFSAGSASDIVAQVIAPALSKQLGQKIAIERHPGDNGAIAAGMAARGTRDGRTMYMATLGTHAILPCIRKELAYHPLRDFIPVSLVARAPLVMAVYPRMPVASVAELIKRARSGVSLLTFASSAFWGAPHLAGELFSFLAGVKMTHVPYDETKRLYADLLGGQVDMSINNVMSMRPLIESGRLRGLATTGPTRSPVLSDLPTLAEEGLTDYEVLNWLGICVPAGTPHEVVDRLSQALTAVLSNIKASSILTRQGMEIVASSPEIFASYIKSELERWAPVLRRINHRIQDR